MNDNEKVFISFIKRNAQLLSLTCDSLISERFLELYLFFISHIDRWLTLMSWIVCMGGRVAIQTLITYVFEYTCLDEGCMK